MRFTIRWLILILAGLALFPLVLIALIGATVQWAFDDEGATWRAIWKRGPI
jgi:hypothetical protein